MSHHGEFHPNVTVCAQHSCFVFQSSSYRGIRLYLAHGTLAGGDGFIWDFLSCFACCLDNILIYCSRTPAIVNPVDSRSIHRLVRTQLSEERFKAFWSSRRPFVVKDLQKDLQASWEPAFFIRQYGSTVCEVQDCETGKEWTCTVAEFFSLFGRAEIPDKILKLKVSCT